MVAEHIPRAFPRCPCGFLAIVHRPSHNPKAWPVCTCGARAENHRVKHHFEGAGETCSLCNLLPEKHIMRGSRGRERYRYDWVGIDGEGIGRKPHRYVMLCAATSEGQQFVLENVDGLGSRELLTWTVNTLYDCRVFSYGFGYDISMIVKDLPDHLIYDLLRPHRRYDKGKLRPIHWHGFALDWLNGKLTVSKGPKRVAIWDLVKFYQQRFVKSLQDWGIDTENIEEMKERRGKFDAREMSKIRAYCLTECRQLATLAEKLVAAHKDAGLVLKSYFGPGSTASVALNAMKVNSYKKDPPKRMLDPIARAFFGGWFEHSTMGIVKEVYAYDISSAYPYHAYNLPCLRHGRWVHHVSPGRRLLNDCTTALIHYEYKGRKDDVWAPFPHRNAKGAIAHPYRGMGWVWLPEFQAARGMGAIKAVEAWVYKTDCQCRPFASVADYYRRRSELGKDARGKVIKLAINSIYGKLAQSKGPTPRYQNWIWAGLITSGTRAQVLCAIQCAPSMSDIIAIATDGVFSRSPLHLEAPNETGTFDLKKPLGGWEEKHYPDGMLFVKPGVYFSLGKTTCGECDSCKRGDFCEKDNIKARGLGRKALTAQRQEVIDAYKRGERTWTVHVERFHGAKSCITPKRRAERFGQWATMPINVRFECPNRNPDMTLLARDTMSVPYHASLITREGLQAALHRDISYDQP